MPNEEDIGESFLDELTPTVNQQQPQQEPKQESEPPPEEPDDKNLFPQKKKAKASTDESIQALRKQRDELRDSLEKHKAIFGDYDLEALSPIVNFVKESTNGVVTKESISEYLERIKKSNEELEQLNGKLKEKDNIISDLDIRSSQTFKEQYQKPYDDAAKSIQVEIANFDPEKKILGPKATQKFFSFLTGTEGVDAVDLKIKINEFTADYKKETGEDYPTTLSVTNIMSSVREFNHSRNKMGEAYQNWQTLKKEAEDRKLVELSQTQEVKLKENARLRKNLASKAYQDFDIDEYSFLTSEEAQDFFHEEFKMGEGLHKGEVTIPPYNELITRGVKARMFDKFYPRFKELLELEKNLDKNERSGIRGSDRSSQGNNNSALTLDDMWDGK